MSVENETLFHPEDFEIEYAQSGPIIHIFPQNGDPEKTIHDLLVGHYLLHSTVNTEIIPAKDRMETMARIIESVFGILTAHHDKKLIAGENYAKTFIKKMRYK